ncbi:MAG: ABC transporter ATP-binding protein [Leptotrichiaceae bacterium]|nr:ABC transporter ATP-binding protein [Leptotrichiaceae bacterium]MBP6281251.1 ABC transporter ATP-binding protein [Leptotrichiaceae bacterium]MBP7101182.1 ABC transporter ATP-binding protein [Leptotrichiaceae bacterium]MBP9630018.1 ABC transporter ATP-binding protein [Leptotrichiaceae bacterium]
MLKKLFSYVGEYKKESILAPILIAMEVLIEISIPFLMASIIDNGLSKSNMNHIFFMGGISFLLATVSMISGIGAGKYAARAAAGFSKNIRKALFYKIQKYSFTNIDKFSTAGLITRFTTDINNIQNSYQMIIRIFVRAPFMMVFATIMAVYISPSLSLIYIVAVIFLGIMVAIIFSKVHPIFTRAVKKYDKINNNLQENISGIRVVKAYVRENYEKNKFKESTLDLKDTMLKGEKIIVFVSPLMQFSMYFCTLLLSWFGAKLIISDELTTGQLMSLFAYTANILVSLLMFSMVLVTITLSRASAERIIEVLDEEPSIVNNENPIYEIKNGDIEFKNVDFSYSNNANVLNLEKINIFIKEGETIGIIGGTGSAKSAFVQLIPRLYDVISGEVLVGNVNVKEYDLKALRDNVAMVLQKNVLFSGTINENLRWGNKDATDDEIINAAKLAQADEFIQKFPDKYNTYIEQGGTNVSGGQRQRLCIARALLKNPKILILDDSTSAVDTKTDRLIRNAFKNNLPNITKIIISQRVSSIKDSDKIIVLEDGKIDGVGTHEELIISSKIYKEIHETQMEGGVIDEEKQ